MVAVPQYRSILRTFFVCLVFLNVVSGQYNGRRRRSMDRRCSKGSWGSHNVEHPPCKSCVAGRYNDVTGIQVSSSCKLCPRGKYNDETGQESAASCIECSTGQYQNEAGRDACIVCEKGQYQVESGKMICRDCVGGKTTSGTGGKHIDSCVCGNGHYGNNQCKDPTSASECPIGYFSNELGSPKCTKCEIGKYQDETIQSNCKDCNPPGKTDQSTLSWASTNILDCKSCSASTTASVVNCTTKTIESDPE